MKHALPLLLLSALPARGLALTTPVTGAAARPAALTLVSPYPCGVTYKVTGGYGGSLHVNINDPTHSNDYYALDMQRDETGSGHAKPVAAVAAGTVKYAGWASGGWSTYGQIVILELAFSDGHAYQVIYAHLDQVLVSVGQQVKARDVVGHQGRSGNNSLTYWSATHLHMAMYRDAKLGSGGPYGGVAMVPEPLDGVEDIVVGTTATASCAPPSPDGGPTSDSGPGTDGATPHDAGGEDQHSDGTAGLDSGGLPPVAGDGVIPSHGGDDGCGCRAGRGEGYPPLALLLLLALLRRRR